MLPFEPESLCAAKARLPAALEPLLTRAQLLAGTAPRIGLDRRHVFDFEDGMRVIVSREDHGGGAGMPLFNFHGTVIHASASFFEGQAVERLTAAIRTEGAEAAKRAFQLACESRLRELFGPLRRLPAPCWSADKGVPNWFIPYHEERA